MQTPLFNRAFISTGVLLALFVVFAPSAALAQQKTSAASTTLGGYQTTAGDDVAKGSLVPCTNKCDINSFFQLLNNILTFLIKVVVFPIVIISLVWGGYQYMTSGGAPAKRAMLRGMIWHIVLGMVLILCSWVIVRTILVTLGYSDGLLFFQ